MHEQEWKKLIRNVEDYPVAGIQFKDLTPLFAHAEFWRQCLDAIYQRFAAVQIDIIASIEARGFILGGALAYKFNCGFVPIRKAGKLPSETIQTDYQLEYGTGKLEIHRDAFMPNANVLLADDLIATGGTLKASLDLIQQLQGKVVGIASFVELSDLGGRKALEGVPIFSLIRY